MSEITKEKMLEWLEMECVNCNCAPRESEVCREQEDIDQCLSTVAALEALIESSSPSGSIGKAEGEKASGGGVVFHAWKDGKWLGVVADPALSDRIFIGHIQSHLQEGEKVVCKICGRTAEEITGQAAPSPAAHPLSKLTENMVDMTPEQHKAADECLKELIHGTPAPTIKKDLTVGPSAEGYWDNSGQHHPAIGPSPATKEVEKAMIEIEAWKTTYEETVIGVLCLEEWQTRADKSLAVIKEALLAGAWAIRDRQNEASLSKPAPLSKDVEGAMEKIITRLEGRDCSEEIVFIKAALQRYRELGIEVGEKP
jgi:hypothetical protein